MRGVPSRMRATFQLWAMARWRPASRHLAVSLAALLLLAAVPALASQPRLTDVRVGVHKKFTRVVLQTDAAVRHRIHQGKGEIRVQLDATSSPRAVAAKSPQLTWVKVSPTSRGSEVRIRLRHPARVRQMVLHKPDRLVLDVYAASHVAEAKPPAPPVKPAPPPKPPATASAPAPSASAAGGASAAAGAAAGEAALPAETQPPSGAAPSAAPTPAQPGPGVAAQGEAAGAPAGSELPSASAGPAAGTGQPQASAPQPVPVPRPHPHPRGFRSPLDFLPPPFDQPITLGLIAVLLLALFVLIRVRRRRVAQESLSPFPPEEEEVEQEPTPVQEIAALGQESEEPAALSRPAPESPPPPGPGPSIPVPPAGPPPTPPGAPAAPAAAGGPVASGEIERRVAHLESRLEEVLDAKERLERQVAAQTEELRVQRAAIARTQRVLRSIARPEDEATEPAPKV